MATVTVRPNATTLLSGTYIVSPSGTAHAATDDDPVNDSSNLLFGPSTSGGAPAKWEFTTTGVTAFSSLSPGAIPKSYRLRARMKKQVTATAAWRATNRTTGANASGYLTSSSYSTITCLQATLTSWIAPPWRLESLVFASGVFVSEVYVDMTYVAKPVTNVSTTSSTYIDNDVPSVLWSNTLDSDGGAQTYYQVKVYGSDDYNAPGFNPASTLANLYDSGVVSSGANTLDLPSLATGSYRAYVRVGQTVNGATHWSDYDYEQFAVVSLVPADPTAVTAVADSTYHRVELNATVAGGGTPTQLVTNSSFATNTTGWTATTTNFTSAGLTQETSDWTGHDSGYAKLTGIKDANTTERTISASTATGASGIAVSANSAYSLVALFKASDTTASGGFRTRIRWYKSDGSASATASTASSLTTIAAGAEDTIYLSATSPSDAAYAAVAFEATTSTSGDTVTFYVDDVLFAERPSSDLVAFERSTDDGDTWEEVRALDNAGQPVTSLSATVYDYEVGNGVDVKYRARALHDYGASTYSTSDWVETAEIGGWTSTSWVLKAPTRPDLNVSIRLSSLPSQDRAARTSVFQPLGAAESIAVSETRGTASGAIGLLVDTVAEREALDAILDLRTPLLIQGVPGQYWDDRYVAFDSWQRVRAPDKAFIEATIDTSTWREVSPPEGPVDLDAWPDSGS